MTADSRSLNFWIFPLAVLGNVSEVGKRKTYFGTIRARKASVSLHVTIYAEEKLTKVIAQFFTDKLLNINFADG